MTELHPDLLSVLEAVVIHSPTRFAVRDRIHELSGPSPDDLSSEAAASRERQLLSALEADIYQYLYIRPAGPCLERPGDELARRERVAALRAANTSRGTWNGGWFVREMDRDGKLVLRKDNLTIWAAPEQVQATDGEIWPGQTCRIWIGNEQRNRILGFYFAVGEAEDECDGDESEPLLRYYWHLSSEAAVPFVAAATELLNATGAPFCLKVLADPGAFRRADAALIFVRKRYHRLVIGAVARIHDAVASGLRESVPLFTKPVARGLGAAEGPSGRLSFGDHRCKLAAKAIWRSFLRGQCDRASRAATLAAVYREEGLDPRYPYLAAGSTDEFVLAIAPEAPARRTLSSDRRLGAGQVVTLEEACRRTISPREAAIRIGESLCRKAVWDVTGRYCNWIGRIASGDGEREGPPRVTAAALGPDLHEGSAGIALFLTQLHAATGNYEFRRTAQAAIARSNLLLAKPRAAAPYSTRTNLALSREAAMLCLHAVIRDPDFKDHRLAEARAAISAVLDAIDAHITVPRFDATIRDGLAGLGEVVLTAGVVLNDRSYQDRALSLGQTLIDRYSALDDWPTGLPCGGPNPSLMLGTAGIGYWLLRLDEPERVPSWLGEWRCIDLSKIRSNSS